MTRAQNRQLVITTAVNLKQGLPAAVGKNTAIMNGDLQTGTCTAVQDSAQ